MVAASAAVVNTFDIPEAAFGAQKTSRKNKHVVPKWSLDLAEEHKEVFSCKPDLEAMFPSFESNLVQAIVAESSTWEKALGVLLALADDKMEFVDRQSPIAKDPVTDHVGFPALLDADGWEVVRASDLDEKDHPMWRDVVRDVANGMQSIHRPQQCEKEERCSLMVFQGLSGKVLEAVAESCDLVEGETEHECRQRRGEERRWNRAKHNRRPSTSSTLSDVKKVVAKREKGRTDAGPPAWRLCRLEDRL